MLSYELKGEKTYIEDTYWHTLDDKYTAVADQLNDNEDLIRQREEKELQREFAKYGDTNPARLYADDLFNARNIYAFLGN